MRSRIAWRGDTFSYVSLPEGVSWSRKSMWNRVDFTYATAEAFVGFYRDVLRMTLDNPPETDMGWALTGEWLSNVAHLLADAPPEFVAHLEPADVTPLMLDGGPQAAAAALHALGLIQLRLDRLGASQDLQDPPSDNLAD